MSTNILGISAFYHDSAAALIRDGEIIAAAQEERFSREKHDSSFPSRAIQFCLEQACITTDRLDYIGFYEKPLIKFDRLLETYLHFAPRGFRSFRKALPLWVGQKLHLGREMDRELGLKKHRYVFCEHHESHAASAFFPSPFEEAAIVTMDGVGEWATATVGHGRENKVSVSREIRFPHSLGLLYSAFTYYTGFWVNSGEYKMMGLAPYGKPVYVDLIRDHLIDIRDDGSFWMDMSFFNYAHGLTMTSEKFHRLFGRPPRKEKEPLEQHHMDLASSAQKIVEEVMLKTVRHAHEITGSKNLCLAGGVALNCVANGRIAREGPFEEVWIQPAAGDGGGALGVALLIWHQLLGNGREAVRPDGQAGSLLGPEYESGSIQSFLRDVGAEFEVLEDPVLMDRVSQKIAQGKVIGWFQGRMEYGPRALGCRSIIGDARNPDIQTAMNLKVKFRESFRPFAPSAMSEHAGEHFEMERHPDSPYMLLVTGVRGKRRRTLIEKEKSLTGIDLLKLARSEIPAVTHVDYSARVQTVDAARYPRYWKLLSRFREMTGCPVIVNTSFNLSWEPIVNSPQEAYSTFMATNIDALVLENVLVLKENQRSNRERRRVSSNAGQDPAFAEVCCCPACRGRLQIGEESATCSQCGEGFTCKDGIWRLYSPHDTAGTDVTRKVKEFYEEYPFPNYEPDESLRTLIEKARRGIFARLLSEQLPYNSRILEVGCGTGQLSNFLGIGCRSVFGTDLCMNSLKLAEGFRSRQQLSRVRFLHMNLFRPAFRSEQFDVVICNGVLHHTSDPRSGFESISRLVRPGGYLIVGLYNRYGRLLLDARRLVFRLTGGRARWVDPYIRTTSLSKTREDTWFADQYKNPHESKHTMGEVLAWCRSNGLDFINAIPRFRPWEPFTTSEQIFRPSDPGNALDRALSQGKLMVTGSREGGFYVVIARKPRVEK